MCKKSCVNRCAKVKGIVIIKEIDKLGRIVIPKEMRDRLALGDAVELTLTEEGVLIRNPEYRLVKVLSSEDKR